MENVYLDLELDDEYDHPDNRGWINLFGQWSDSPMIRATWALSASTFGARFQTFCRRRLGLEHGEVVVAYEPSADPREALMAKVRQESTKTAKELEKRASELEKRASKQIWLELKLSLPGDLQIPVGFCVLEPERVENTITPVLIYFQIHQHLRRTGVARRGLTALARSKEVQKITGTLTLVSDDHRLQAISQRRWNAFKDLFDSLR